MVNQKSKVDVTAFVNLLGGLCLIWRPTGKGSLCCLFPLIKEHLQCPLCYIRYPLSQVLVIITWTLFCLPQVIFVTQHQMLRIPSFSILQYLLCSAKIFHHSLNSRFHIYRKNIKNCSNNFYKNCDVITE